VRASDPDALFPCPQGLGGPQKTCFGYKTTDLTQDPNSHHSIISIYRGTAGPTDPAWGKFTCHGGANDGAACNPLVPGVAAPAGADCGERSGCAGAVVSSVACLGYGPPDLGFNGAGFAGSQAPHARQDFFPGVYDVLPVRGTVVWNSHAFNLSGVPTTNEQWLNILFAAPSERQYRVQVIFDLSHIFDENVAPFTSQEICNYHELPRGARLFQLSSHTHKRGKLFRVWDPAGNLVITTTVYNDPTVTRFHPPPALADPDPTTRTLKYCAIYDNGATNPQEVKRQSTSPYPPAGRRRSGAPCRLFNAARPGGPPPGGPCLRVPNKSAANAAGPPGDCERRPRT